MPWDRAALTSALSSAGIDERGLRVTGPSIADATGYLPTGTSRSSFGAAVPSVETDTYVHRGNLEFASVLTWRADECDHLRIVRGRCPTSAGDVLFSAASSKALKLGVGSSYPITGGGGTGSYPIGRGRIVGLCEHFDEQSDYHGYQFPGGTYLESRSRRRAWSRAASWPRTRRPEPSGCMASQGKLWSVPLPGHCRCCHGWVQTARWWTWRWPRGPVPRR